MFYVDHFAHGDLKRSKRLTDRQEEAEAGEGDHAADGEEAFWEVDGVRRGPVKAIFSIMLYM